MNFSQEDLDFAAKDETDVYLFLKDSGFDDCVAKEFESESLSIRHRRRPLAATSVPVRNLFKHEGGGIGVGARACMLSN